MFLYPTAGKLTVMDIMVMMDCFIGDMEKERHLARPIQLVIQLVVVSTMLHKNSFSRKLVNTPYHFKLFPYIF